MKRIIAAAALSAFVAGCGSQKSSSTQPATAGAPGSIVIAGSTAMLPLVKQAAAEYRKSHANVKISVSGGGSLAGLAQVAQRSVDVADSDIPAVNEPSLVDHRVAIRVSGKKYPYRFYEHMYTNGQPSAQVAGFIQYVANDAALLRRLKFLRV